MAPGWLGSSAILNMRLSALESEVAAPAHRMTTASQPVGRRTKEQRSQWSTCLLLLRAQPGNGMPHFYSHSLDKNLVIWLCLAVRKAGKCSQWLGDHVLGKTQAFIKEERENGY